MKTIATQKGIPMNNKEVSTETPPSNPKATDSDSPENPATPQDTSAKAEKKSEQAPQLDLISFTDFQKVQLRIAQIASAERIEKSEKLIKLQVTIGDEQRQIIAGVAKHYQPEALVGRKIVVVANLKPAKLMGEKSEGMLLAASDDQGNLALLDVDPIIPSGAEVR